MKRLLYNGVLVTCDTCDWSFLEPDDLWEMNYRWDEWRCNLCTGRLDHIITRYKLVGDVCIDCLDDEPNADGAFGVHVGKDPDVTCSLCKRTARQVYRDCGIDPEDVEMIRSIPDIRRLLREAVVALENRIDDLSDEECKILDEMIIHTHKKSNPPA